MLTQADVAAQQGGGDAAEESTYGKARGDLEAARVGKDIRDGGPPLPFRDVYAREADALTIDVAVGGETKTMTLREATAVTGREYGVLYYSDQNGVVQYRVFEANTTDPDVIGVSWNHKTELPLAFIHTHPGETDSTLALSMLDVRTSFKDNNPVYILSTNAPGSNTVVGTSIMSYTPGVTVASGYARTF